VPDAQISPQSLQWQKAGEAALAAGQFQAADDALETALIIDPRNRGAFVALARVAQRQKLYGQAIRFTNKALALEPNDPVALGVQGEAMVELGAVSRAQQNLAKIKTCAAPGRARRRPACGADPARAGDGGQGRGSRRLRRRTERAGEGDPFVHADRLRPALGSDAEPGQGVERAGTPFRL
jgi:hypothetical protein